MVVNSTYRNEKMYELLSTSTSKLFRDLDVLLLALS